MERGEEWLADVANWYDEFDGRGENPREFNLDDCDYRRRSKYFKRRAEKRSQLTEEYNKAREKWKKN